MIIDKEQIAQPYVIQGKLELLDELNKQIEVYSEIARRYPLIKHIIGISLKGMRRWSDIMRKQITDTKW